MKLYSQSQVIRRCIYSALATGIIVLSVVLLVVSGCSKKEEQKNLSQIPADQETENKPVDDGMFPVSTRILEEGENDYEGLSEEEKHNIMVYEQLNSGVVNITTEVMGFDFFYDPVPQAGGSGSGSIITSDGYILTNKHVVASAIKVYVNLADGSQYEGQVVGTDGENDLAVIKFDPGNKQLVTVPFGDSRNLKVGQKVIAIGNPYALDRTMTTGIVSGLGRPVRADTGLVIREMIQTDASINPGNSGGPLLDSQGRMIGVNTSIISPSGGSVGIGFAVPVEIARRVVPDLIKFGQVKRGWIDVIPVQITNLLYKSAQLPLDKGLLISRVTPGGNAAQAGLLGGAKDKPIYYGNSVILLGGDIIVEVDGLPVYTYTDLFSALEDNKPSDVVKVVFYRGKEKKQTEVVLTDRPENLIM